MPWADASLLDQLPNGGAVVALITVVILFLKKQERSEETIQAIVESFTAEIAASRKEYREHVTGIMTQGLEAHAETREAIRSLDATLGKYRGVDEQRPPQKKSRSDPV